MPGFERAKNDFKKFIAMQASIKPHKYVIDEELKEKIYKYFKMTIERWGYDV